MVRTRWRHTILGVAWYRQLAAAAGVAIVCLSIDSASSQEPARLTVKSPIVTIVGCAASTAEPHIWVLAQAGERTLSATAGITTAEKQDLSKRSLGRDTYQLIGVADFVDVDTSRRIGVRDRILSRPRVNTTAMLASGHKVAVKGLYIDARPPRINLTSVVDLGGTCP